MASNRDNTVVLTTLLNGEQAEKELRKLQDHARELEKAIRQARKSGDFKLAEGLKKESNATKDAIKKLKKEVIDVNSVLKNLSSATMNDLRKAQREMRKQMDNGSIKRGTKEWDYYNKKMVEVRQEMQKITAESQVAESKVSRLTDTFNKYFASVMTVVGAVTGISFTLRKLSQDAALMEDTYADVMKTTGMTREEVGDLNEEFKKLSTRTAREELNNLARDAGKLGLTGKKDILDFVEAGNQINVALGEDLGEGAIKNIGKMTDVFKLSTKELNDMDLKERMLSVGSAINELGQSSTASELYLVNFAQRLGGVASQAGISIQSILGYASALDQSGQAVEMSATAFQKFIMQLLGDTPKYARLAGVEIDKFNRLIATDTNEAIKLVLTSLSNKGGFQQLIPVFQEMGMDGARAVGVLSSLATNIEKVDEAQQIANSSFAKATSLTDEYSVKNENAQAILEKRRKVFKDSAEELGSRLNPALLKSMSSITYLIKLMPYVLDFLDKWGKYIFYLVAVYATYTAALKLNVWWVKQEIKFKISYNALLLKERAALVLLNLQYIAASKNLTQLRRSYTALFSLLKLNPFAVVAVAVAALGVGVYQLMKRTTRLTDAAKALSEINMKVADSVSMERAELEMLLGVAKNEKISKEERLKAIAKLNEISPEYLGNLDLENINTGLAAKAVKDYTAALMENAKQKAIVDKVNELYAKRLKEEAAIFNINQRIEERRNSGKLRGDVDVNLEYAIKRHETNMSFIDKEIDMYNSLNQTIETGKKSSDSRYIELETQMLNEIKALDDLEQRHADVYNKMYKKEDGVYVLRKENDNLQKVSFDSSFIDQNELTMLNHKINAQRQIVKDKEVEFELEKKRLKELGKVKIEQDIVFSEGDSDTSKDKSDPLKEREQILKLGYDKEILLLKQQLLEREITQEEYDQKAYMLEVKHLLSLLDARRQFGEETVDVEMSLTDKMIAEVNRRHKLAESLEKDMIDSVKKRPGEEAVDEDFSPQNFEDEKVLLEQRLQFGQITEQEYQEALWKLREAYLNKYLGKYMDIANEMSHVTGDLSEAFNAFQQAEEMSITRKYDNMIKAAGNNSKKVAKLEEEKEEAIQKTKAKYADKQFILTVANVISSTAMAAINAYASAVQTPVIGPVLAPIAAAAATLYGAGQIAIAKQQHANAKQGYASGGYTGTGKWWEEDGVVHKNEFVGNRFAVQNPTVKRIFDVVDQAQRTNTVGSLSSADFETALNYKDYSRRKAFKDAIANLSTPKKDSDNNNDFLRIVEEFTETNRELKRRLDEPIVAETYIEGKGGSKQANDLYNKMKKNISR